MPRKDASGFTDLELARSYGAAQENSIQRNEMEGEVLRRQLEMQREEMDIKRQELVWVSRSAKTAIGSFLVLGLCAIISTCVDVLSL